VPNLPSPNPLDFRELISTGYMPGKKPYPLGHSVPLSNGFPPHFQGCFTTYLAIPTRTIQAVSYPIETHLICKIRHLWLSSFCSDSMRRLPGPCAVGHLLIRSVCLPKPAWPPENGRLLIPPGTSHGK